MTVGLKNAAQPRASVETAWMGGAVVEERRQGMRLLGAMLGDNGLTKDDDMPILLMLLVKIMKMRRKEPGD
jgi:hypothetical protein